MAGRVRLCAAFGIAVGLSACFGGGRERIPHGPSSPEFHPAVDMLLRFDANHDGTVTRAEMEKGLKADFDAADTNHDGRLNEDEAREVNHQRWSENASTASPVVDWNQDGYVDFDEFANTARSLFDDLDKDGDGKLSPKELHPHGDPDHPDAKDDGTPRKHGGHRPGGDGGGGGPPGGGN